MPSILSRLLGRKKSQEPESSADKPGYPTPLLEGKFEAVSPTVSPSAAFFSDPRAAEIRGIERSKDKESPFHVFRARSRPSSDSPAVDKAAPDVPHLSLNLPLAKERGRALDVVFESNPDSLVLLNETTIKERRFTPREALSLVQACSQVILERGLETLGIMHPHWHSASPEVQHRLISLYLLSLASTNRNDATSPTSPTAPATFEYELHYACSPHDAAAVLRWGLRHLKLDGNSFGKESGDWTWYNAFAEAERTGSYPPDAFSKLLTPQLPTAHSELLLATLDIISSLSTRSEANGSSGSKLSKFFGLWLLTCEDSTEADGWRAFYDRWDRAGRILEHLFLAKIRNDARSLPRRLTDLVEHYPYYDIAVDAPKDDLLPRPRFSTRQYDALFVRLDTEYTGALKPKSHPLRLIADALRAQLTGESATPEDVGLWDVIKKASLISHTVEGSNDAALEEPVPVFSNIFSDETIRLLSLIPLDVSDKDKPAPTFILQSPISPGRPSSFSRPESPLSPVQADRGRSPPSGHVHIAPSLTANNSTAPTTALETPTDWLQFSSNGFGAIPGTRDLVATLWDNDVEVTAPPPAPLSRKSSRRTRSRSRHSRHSSFDSPQTPVPPLPTVPAISTSKTTLIAKIKLDEAFIDFWADSLLDPISRRWPSFVLCQLKSLPTSASSATPTPAWLVIEQRFVRVVPAPVVNEDVETTVPPARPRASSPRPESSRLSAAFSIASKRFGFFAGGSSDPKSPKEKMAPLPQVGESGDGAAEEVEKSEEAGAEGSVDQGAVPALTRADATALAVVGAATATVAAAQEEVTQKPGVNDLPAGTAEAAPSELAGVSAPKADELVKDEQTHSATTQEDLVHDSHHDDEQYELKSETIPAPSPAGADPLVSPPEMGELVKTETEPRAEAETALPEPTSAPSIPYFAGISEGPPARAEAAPPEPSVVPVVEEAASVEGIVTASAVPEPAISHASVLEESKSANAPAAEPTPAPVQAPTTPVPAAAIEEPVVDDTAAEVVEPEPVVKFEATEQDLPANEVAPDAEGTRTFEEVSARAAEPVIVTEMPKAALAEGSVEDLPVEPTSATAAVLASEQTAPKDDILTMREAQVATSADSELIVVEESSATHPDVPTDDAAPAIQTSPIHSIDAVETTAPLEEPAEVAGGSVIKEDAQPAAIPERDDTVPKESDEVEATAPEPAKEPSQVASDTALPALENTDSAAEAPAPNDEPDVGNVVVVTESVEESLLPHDTPRVQDAVIEEQLTAEETNPIPDAPTGEPIPAGDRATSHDNETDAVPAESAVAENTPVDEPTTSSEVSPLVLEGPVTEPAPEPRITIASDDSPADASAKPAVARAEQANAEATVLVNENESTASPIDELKVQPSVAADSQVTTNDSESVLPHEEPSPTAPDASRSVVEEPAPPDAEIPAAQEPPLNEATALDTAEIPVEAPASVPAESGLLSEEGAPATADASVVNPVPAIEEPTPFPEDVVPVTAEAPSDPSPLPEEPAPAIETAVPAVETAASVPEQPNLTHEQSAPDTVETPLDEPGPVVQGASSAVEEDGPVVKEDGPVVEEDGPVVEDGPAVENGDPIVEKDDPILQEDGPIVEKDDTVVNEDDPVAEEVPAAPEPPVENSAPPEDLAPAIESAAPTADETLVENPEHDQEGLSTLEPAAAAAEETAPATEEQAGSGETAQAEPSVEESLPQEEQATQAESPSVPGLDATTASEPEAPLAAVDSASSETTGATDPPSW